MSNPVAIVPKISSPIADAKGYCTADWFLALQSLWNPQPESSVSPTGSPFTFKVQQPGFLLVIGGTVSAISLIRSTTTVTGLTSGFIPCSTGDSVVLAYTVAPTLVFFPR